MGERGMTEDLWLLAAVSACAIAAAVLAVAGAWLFRLDQRLGLKVGASNPATGELIDVLSAIGEDPSRVLKYAARLDSRASALITLGLRLARDRAEPLAFGREMLRAAQATAAPLHRTASRMIALAALVGVVTIVAWALPLMTDGDGWARLAVGLGYVGVLALFSVVAFSAGTQARVGASDHQMTTRLVVVAFLGLSVGESRDQIRTRLIEAASRDSLPLAQAA